jgi:4-diphosphocytidyl-2-C-methyl-D-erythritol kinase
MSSPGPWVRAFAPAKVNPFLEIVGVRSDGYHEVDTLMLALELGDELALRVTDSGRIDLRLEGAFATSDVPSDARNLAVAAASEVLARASAARRGLGLEIVLDKRIPSQAGLGGGSSDAAAALLAAERALEYELDESEARALLARLGSDCVFFRAAAATGFAHCRGRGELVEPLDLGTESPACVIVAPECGAPTAQIYAALARPLRNGAPPRSLPTDSPALARLLTQSSPFNRLEEAALATVPSLRAWRRLLDDLDLSHFRLAGSGSSFFGLFEQAQVARDAHARLVDSSRAAGLATRGTWLSAASGRGARLLS